MNINKLENPQRIAELNPTVTLKKAGLVEKSVLCDIGAGTGLFTIPAAKISKNKVFAIEIKQDLVELIRDKAKKESLTNIVALQTDDNKYSIEDKIVDFALMVTVFHEIPEKETLLKETKRILTSNGKLVIIEFHDKLTPYGPPVSHRIGKEETTSICKAHGFSKNKEFDLGENFYCIVFNI